MEVFRAAFSEQMARHVSLVLGAVERCHWRLNPGVLLGRSVSVVEVVSVARCQEQPWKESAGGGGGGGHRGERSCGIPATRLG